MHHPIVAVANSPFQPMSKKKNRNKLWQNIYCLENKKYVKVTIIVAVYVIFNCLENEKFVKLTIIVIQTFFFIYIQIAFHFILIYIYIYIKGMFEIEVDGGI